MIQVCIYIPLSIYIISVILLQLLTTSTVILMLYIFIIIIYDIQLRRVSTLASSRLDKILQLQQVLTYCSTVNATPHYTIL